MCQTTIFTPQVDFFPQGGGTLLHASSVARAAQRLRAAKEFQVAAPLQRLKGRVSARYAALKSLQLTPKHVKLRDKLTFASGVMLALISAFWLGSSPSTFYKLYTFKAIFLFALRFFLYKKSRMHYYLLDFCYYANFVLVVQVWLFNDSCAVEKIMFAFAMGPLAWSILAFRNSMIFHSLDKVLDSLSACLLWALRMHSMRSCHALSILILILRLSPQMTSLFLHVFPPLVAWAIRWYPGDVDHWNGPKTSECTAATLRELILIPGMPYGPVNQLCLL